MIPSLTLSILPLLLLPLNTTGLAHSPHHSNTRVNNRLARTILDENFIDTPGTPQNLCGDSTFHAVDGHGPVQEDCVNLRNTVDRNQVYGFWMVGSFGSNGTSWVEFTRLRTCGIEIRRMDGRSDDVPLGNEDVVDLVNSVLAQFSEGRYLPMVHGQMICSKDDSGAAVEWRIFGS